jgi:prepilin-type N-terminal cleavage/methylation domain-containing protein
MDVGRVVVPRRRHAGYSLLEILVAIAIVGMALLVSSNALQAHAALARRTEMRLQLQRAAENALESVRGDVVPLDTGPLAVESGQSGSLGGRMRTIVTVTEGEIEGLYEVKAVARAHHFGEAMAVELYTKVWRP